MNETIIQIIPAPSNLMYGYDGGTAQPGRLPCPSGAGRRRP